MNITKNRLISGIVYIVLGVLIAAGPQTLFAVCESMGDSYMKCHWTAQAEIGCGLAIAALGIFLLCFSSELIRIGIQSALILQSLQAVLIPSVLIGVCGGNHMRCHALTLPALNVLGTIGIIVGAINLIYLWKRKGKEQG